MSDFSTQKDQLIHDLLQQRDEMYQELSWLRKIDDGTLELLEEQNKKLTATIADKDQEIKKLLDHIAWFKNKMFGKSSEKHIVKDPNQLEIDWGGVDLLPEEKEIIENAEKELISYERVKPEKKKGKAIRQPIPDNLRREIEVIEPEGVQPDWVRIGVEVSETIEFKPGELYVRRIERPKYAVKQAVAIDSNIVENTSAQSTGQNVIEESTIRIAPMPLLPFPRCNAGASLVAEIVMNKYFYHIPFHRQIAMFKMLGVSLPASTINGWFIYGCDLVRAIYYRLRETVLSSDYIQVDESTIPVINDEKNKTKKAYLWMVRSVMDKTVFFHYDKGSRAQAVIVELLKDYKGAIQADGYQAYSIYDNKKGVLLLGCWAHARRKFTESLLEDKTGAEYALAQIGKIYKVEYMANDQNLSYDERAELRKRLAHPIMLAFKNWLENYYSKTIPNGRMYGAIRYTLNIFNRLSRYHLDGRYLPDNNGAENAIRPLAVGRKGYLFCGNDDAAENAAVMYSLFACCKASDVNPREWLTDIFNKVPRYNNDYTLDLADLLPHNWKKHNAHTSFPSESR